MDFATRIIELEYQNSIECANELEECSDLIRQVSSVDINDILESLQASWKGDAANACIRKVSGLNTELQKDVGKVEKTASVIRTIAENVRRAELTALSIAANRRY